MSHIHHDNLQLLRNKIKAQRQAMPAGERSRGALLMRGRLFTWLASNKDLIQNIISGDKIHIAAFWALPGEPELQPLLKQWANDNDIMVSLPIVKNQGLPLAWRQWRTNSTMHTGAYNIQEPDGTDLGPDQLPDIVLVPTLGYTRQGDRLGYGGGFYDRTLAAMQNTGHSFISIGIAWACGDLSNTDYNAQAHDIRLDSILTDKGWAVDMPRF